MSVCLRKRENKRIQILKPHHEVLDGQGQEKKKSVKGHLKKKPLVHLFPVRFAEMIIIILKVNNDTRN